MNKKNQEQYKEGGQTPRTKLIEKITPDTHIVIVGLGLMGGSYAMALSKKGYKLKAISKEKEDIDYGLSKGLIAEGSTKVTKELMDWAEVIVFALYPHIFTEWVKENGHLIKPGTLCTDVTGVKQVIIENIQEAMPKGVEFIAAHPMAGRESQGVKCSDDKVFNGANYIVVPSKKNTKQAVKLCKQLGEELGFSHISTLDAHSHDEMIAFLSQLTHLVAVSLMCSNDTPGFEAYTGDSFRDLTRIARINDEMWSELFLLNKDALLKEMDAFATQFEKLRDYLKEGDGEAMREMMCLSKERREKFDKNVD